MRTLLSRLDTPVAKAVAAVVVLALAVTILLAVRPHAAVPAASTAPHSIDAYRGLGTWVSIYDKRAWADPEAAVRDMAGHGVATLYIQTGNSNSTGVVYKPELQVRFIAAAHASGMKIVAWYLPEMKDQARDYDRIAAALALRTTDGQSFDSFALDIESSKIKDESERNAALAAFTVRLRRLVGPGYALGGIVPSPVGIAKQTGFWNDFPYGAVARAYDVMLPMAYYTYHGKGATAASGDASASVGIVRAIPGCATIPIHMIGGLSAKTNAAEVGAFTGESLAKGCIGASLYSWSGTGAAEWDALKAFVR